MRLEDFVGYLEFPGPYFLLFSSFSRILHKHAEEPAKQDEYAQRMCLFSLGEQEEDLKIYEKYLKFRLATGLT